MHSPMYEKLKSYYEKGLYTKEQLHKFVDKGKITEEEYLEIIGE